MAEPFAPLFLTKAVRAFADELFPRQYVCARTFESAGKREVDGDFASWDEVTFSRVPGPYNIDGGKAAVVADPDKVEKHAKLITGFDMVEVPGSKLFRRRAAGEFLPNAEATIGDALKNLLQKAMKRREHACASLLEGTLTPSQLEGSKLTDAISVSVTTGTAAANWTTTSTTLVSTEFPRMINTFEEAAQIEAGIAICNELEARKLLKNDEVQSAVFVGDALSRSFLNLKILREIELGGLQWRVHRGKRSNLAGSLSSYISDETVIVLPPEDALPDVLTLFEGFGEIPVKAFGQGDAGDLPIERAETAGMVAYMVPTHNPVGVEVFLVDRFFPAILQPRAVLNYDTTP